jgi:hypothetical protein
LLKDVGLEIFLIFGHTILLAFEDIRVYRGEKTQLTNFVNQHSPNIQTFFCLTQKQERNETYKLISSKKLTNLIRTESSIDEITNLWKDSKISNYEYLMQLNKFSGRTFNDLMQYPVYPHILSNYASDTLDLTNKDNYR